MVSSMVRLLVIAIMATAAATVVQAADGSEWGGSWQSGPDTTFPQAFSRFDGAYDPATELVYFLGGRLADNNTDGSIWTFDPAAGVYADTGVDMVTPISNYTINVLNDATGVGFYTFCGRPAPGGTIESVQVYYPATNTVSQLPAIDDFPGDATHNCTSALNVVVDNRVYLAGGFDATNNSEQTWVFDPVAAPGSKWTRIVSADLAQPRAYIMGAAVDGLIYAIGGNFYDPTSTVCGQLLCNVTTVEVMDPAAPTPSWTALASLPEECSSSRAWGFDSDSPYQDPTDLTPVAGKIVTGCGWWPDALDTAHAYTVATNTWEAFPSFNTARRDIAGEFIPLTGSTALWVWGGYDGTGANTTTVEYYSIALPPAPPNDDCDGALVLNPGQCVVVTNDRATDSGPPPPSCANYQGGDVWVMMDVPAGLWVDEVFTQNGVGVTDTGLSYYAECPHVTEIECDDDGGPVLYFSSVGPVTGPGTFYFRTWEYGNDSIGEWEVCATELVPVELMEFTIE